MLSLGEKISLVILALLIAATYGCAVWILIDGLVRWIRHKPRPAHSRVVRVGRVVVVVLAVAGVGCLVYAWAVEPYWPEVTQFEVATAKLPAGSGPVRIVQISDTHCEGDKERLEGRLPQIVRELKPDVIVFTGDAANSLRGMHRFRTLMSELAKIAPTYGVRGNWDAGMFGMFEGTGVVGLEGQAVEIDVKGARLCLVGGPTAFAATDTPSAVPALARTDPQRFVIMLFHMPDIVLQMGDRKPDLLLAGHTHGGQVRLPAVGAIVTLQQTGRMFADGVVPYGDMQVHVNRGIGMEGLAPPIRFLCRPQISVIDLRPQ